MTSVIQRYQNFIRGVSVNKTGKLGVILTTSSFITLLLFEFARLIGLLTNSYIGLITYMLFPGVFITGLVLIPIGWKQYKRERGKSTGELLTEAFDKNEIKTGFFGSPLIRTVSLLTIANIAFLGLVGANMLHFMDQPVFCGTACHSVMNPEWTTYQLSPHSRVKCVECHVGEGVDALVSSKLNGLRQMFLASLDIYNRPIPTPVHQLRPARDTCEKCHWPDKFYGIRQKQFIHYQPDSLSTPRYTTLNLKINARSSRNRTGIHWHISADNEVRYASVHDERQTMIWVESRQPDGTFKRYTNRRINREIPESKEYRVLDCVDCHNRATHIYENPEQAIDNAIALGNIDRSLPYLRRTALDAIDDMYGDFASAMQGIGNTFRRFYERDFPHVASEKRESIEEAVQALMEIHRRNIHHHMRIDWGTYPSFIGHRGDGGCFRCHNAGLVDMDGSSISCDCTTCHSILAFDEADPYMYIREPLKGDRNYHMHEYLRKELLHSLPR